MKASSKPAWTTQQREAIEARGGELLVSAGAGSGKTAVLVERVIGLVLDPKAPVDLERILVVTFTEEAADEMRRRIRSAIQERLAPLPPQSSVLSPQSSAPSPQSSALSPPSSLGRLERQMALLERAQISTIHAFCLRLLRENFFRLGIDPQAEVMEVEEARLLKLETLDELFEERYGGEDEAARAFADLVEAYGGTRDDRRLRDAVLSLHDLLESVLDPEAWLVRAIGSYRQPEAWLDEWRKTLAAEIEALLPAYRAALERLTASGMTGKHLEIGRDEFSRLEDILKDLGDPKGVPIDEAFEGFDDWKQEKLPGGGKRTAEQKDAADALKTAREQFKKKILPAASAFQPDSVRKSAARLAPHVEALGALAADFRSAYARAKSEQGGLDFNDLERFALRLLRTDGDAPSETALAQRARFDHVVVDEYQDINPVQEAILSLVAREGPPNRFLVGDVKQCIYGFRLAEPGIFLKKAREYSSAPEALRRRINLTANFRSRPEILEAVNALFRRVFAPTLGGLTYGDDEALRPGADYGEPHAGGSAVELLLLDSAEIEEDGPANDPDAGETASVDRLEAEALEIARRILAWTGVDGNRPVEIRDRATGAMRPAGYGDVAVLLRTMRERATGMAEALRAKGIPVAMASESAFFESTEILDVLSLLRLLDNPRQDIPLAAVLRSPLAGLNESDLAEIRIAAPDAAFHEAFRALAGAESGSPLGRRLAGFHENLERWRTAARSKPLADLLRLIFAETGYFDYVGGLRDGPHRQARLDGLLERARRFGAFRRPTLTRFLRFIDDLADREIELKAPPPPPPGDAVRILSIHQSKGLEFPLVVVADLAKRFNVQDAQGDALWDREYGIGLNEIVLERGERRATAMNRLVATARKDRTRAEEARLLYVAMTRARERLVLSASVDLAKAVEKWTAAAGEPGQPLAPAVLRSANSAIDWIGPALAALPEGETFRNGQPGPPIEPAPGACFRVAFARVADAARTDPRLERKEPSRAEPPWLAALREGRPFHDNWRADPEAVRVAERLEWRYPDLRLAEAPAKISVSEFKGGFERPAEDDEEIRAAFLPEGDGDGLAATERGSLLHAILQRLDLGAPRLDAAEIARQAARMAEQGFFPAGDLARVDLGPLASFFASERGRWLVDCRESVRREAPFCMALPASALEPGLETERARNRAVIVQGVIDALVETGEGFWLLDYKTDAVSAAAAPARAEKYVPQMALYAQAIRGILGRPLLGASLVFLAPGIVHDLDVEALLAWRPSQ